MQKLFRCLLAQTKQSHLDSTFAPVYFNIIPICALYICIYIAIPTGRQTCAAKRASSFEFEKANVKQQQQICDIIK